MIHRSFRLILLLLALTVLFSGCAASPAEPGTPPPDSTSAPAGTTQQADPPRPDAASSQASSAVSTAIPPETVPPESPPQTATTKTQEQTTSDTASGGADTTATTTASMVQPSESSVSTQPETEPSAKEDAVVVHILLPEDGSLVADESETLQADDTALSVLLRVCERCSLAVDVIGSGGTAYVAAIGDYREREQGSLSGWIYKVNGEQVPKSAGAYKLAEGDEVKWIYSLDMGKDAKDR